MSTSRIVVYIWGLALGALPFSVYLLATIANKVGLPFDSGCQPYDAFSGAITAGLIGVVLAILFSVVIFIPYFKGKVPQRFILVGFSIVLVAVSVFVTYESDWCK